VSARSDRGRLRAACLLLAAAVTGALATRALGATGLEHLAPALLAFLLLRSGRYPGERALVQIVRPGAPRGARPPRVKGAQRPRTMARGGLLVADALAGRAPPGVPPP
jgi:hypothetical protein